MKSEASWVQSCMRWGQVNLRELDPLTMDVQWWADFFKRTCIDGLTVNSGGLVAYYPTRIPHHHRSPALGDRDLFGELVSAAKSQGLRVIARLDVGKASIEAFHSHPEWFCRTADGSVIRYEDSDLYYTCINGPYYREFTADVMREIHAHYDVDGFFDNGWQSMPRTVDICHCPACERKFREDTGLPELPSKADWGDPTWRTWTQWRYRCLSDVWRFLAETTAACKPGSVYMGNVHLDPVENNESGRDFLELGQTADMLAMDLQGRRARTNPVQLWAPGEGGRLMRECGDTPNGPKPYYDLFGQFYSGTPAYRVLSKPQAEMKLWLAEMSASGMRPWWHVIGGDHTGGDRRWSTDGVIESHFKWHKETDRYHRGLRSNAEVGLVYAPRSIDFYGQQDSPRRCVQPYQGWYYALMRNRIPFDIVHERKLDEENLSQYRLLILANVACMTEQQIEQVKAFAARGGSVIASFETSLYDEWGKHREELGLADLFGVRWKGAPIGPTGHSYLRIRDRRHPVLGGFDDTDILPFGGTVLPVAGTGVADEVLGYIPRFITHPPEQTYIRTSDTDLSMIFLSEDGTSKRAYFPNDLDRAFWNQHMPDQEKLLGNVLRWMLGDDPLVEIEGEGMLDTHSYDSPMGFQLRMVNLTNPNLFKMPCTTLYPIGPLRVSVRLPGEGVGKARFLVSGDTADVTVRDGRAEVTIPRIEDHEILVFERID